MTTRISLGLALVIAATVLMYWLFSTPAIPTVAFDRGPDNVERGAYLINAGGCISCHEGQTTSGLSGGMGLESEFGIFYVPNITPDPVTGIGSWQAVDFLKALKHGLNPQGEYYFPAFPYRAYAGLTDRDVLDIGAYLLAQPPVENKVPSHETPFWLARWMMAGWNFMADVSGAPQELNSADPIVVRGAYLARNLGHCSECHTPRNALGMLRVDKEYKGATMGESHADAIDAAALTDWSKEDFAFFLLLGMKPDGEFVGGEMEAVIEHNTSMLTDDDRLALAAFFKR